MPLRMFFCLYNREKMQSKYGFFNIEKIIQTFYYIQSHSNVNTKLELIKFLFFADRINIRKHFSFISLDYYVAMRYGPVASTSLDVLNKNDRLDVFPEGELKYLDYIVVLNNSEREIKNISNDLLSKNEMSSLDKSIELFSKMKLVEISHDYPEWKRYKEYFEYCNSSQPIVIDDFFNNPNVNDSPAIQKYFNSVDPLYEDIDYLNEAKDFYLDSIRNHVY